jgi:sugar phosphate isomerase/epimerase
MPLAVFPKCFLDHLVVRHEMTVRQWIDMAATLPVDGLEFYWGFVQDAGDTELAALRQYASQRSLAIPMMCYSPDFTNPDASARQSELEKETWAIAATARLGGKYCRVLSGQRRDGLSRADGIRFAAECITALLPVAEAHNVSLILENHYKDGYWTRPEFAQASDVFLELLAKIPESPWFGVNFDPSNALIAGEDPLALLDAVKSRVVTMHASDRFLANGTLEDLRRMERDPQKGYANVLKHGVIGEGMNDYDAIFSRLADVGFNGWISIEDGDDPKNGLDHLRRSAEFLRRKMKEYKLG